MQDHAYFLKCQRFDEKSNFFLYTMDIKVNHDMNILRRFSWSIMYKRVNINHSDNIFNICSPLLRIVPASFNILSFQISLVWNVVGLLVAKHFFKHLCLYVREAAKNLFLVAGPLRKNNFIVASLTLNAFAKPATFKPQTTFQWLETYKT